MGLKAFEVVAYVHDGEIVCRDCAKEDHEVSEMWSPVFAGDEFDYYPTCSRCNEKITEVNAIYERA